MNAYAEESDEFECIYASYCHKLNDQVCWMLWLISVWIKLKKKNGSWRFFLFSTRKKEVLIEKYIKEHLSLTQKLDYN